MSMLAASRLLRSSGSRFLLAPVFRSPPVASFASPLRPWPFRQSLHITSWNAFPLPTPRREGTNRTGLPLTRKEEEISQNLTQLRLPGLLVPLRMREWPWQNPREFLRYGYNVLWHAFSNLAVRWVLSSKEKPRFFARSRLRFSSGTVSTEAKELHRQLWTAVARGERRELRALCADLFYVNLVQDHVEHRVIGEVWKWNVHRYHRRPRVLINKAMKQGNVYAQLCVVAFDTTQNLRVWTPSGGNEDKKLERRVENLMIIRTFDPVSLAPNKWLIWGPVPGMTLKDQEEDKSLQYRIGSMNL